MTLPARTAYYPVSSSPMWSLIALALVLLLGACIPQTSAFAAVRPANSATSASSASSATSFLTRSAAGIGIVGIATSLSLAKEDEYSDFPPEEGFPGGAEAEYKGDIDWDGEWKKVVSKQATEGSGSSSSSSGKKKATSDRPGKDFYKSDAEIAAIRAANQAQLQVGNFAKKIDMSIPKSMPTSMRSLQGDWKFWIGVLALISVGISLVSAVGQGGPPPDAGGDSYYI
jgi:hypothetical protein